MVGRPPWDKKLLIIRDGSSDSILIFKDKQSFLFLPFLKSLPLLIALLAIKVDFVHTL